MNFKLHPRSWERFFIIPALFLFCLSILINILIFFISDGFNSIPAVIILLLIIFIQVPYSMLKLAPNHNYIATTSYMLLFWGIIQLHLFITNYDNHQPFKFKGIFGFIAITIIAMIMYRILNNPNESEQDVTTN